jgi:hypothetical protein
MAIQGLRTTANFITNQAPENWREGIMLLKPNGTAPLLGLTSVMKSRKVDDPRFHWFDKSMQTRRVALGANVADAATGAVTTVTVTSGALGFKQNDVLKSEQSDEIFRVYADPTIDTEVQLVRGFAGSTTEAITYAGAGVNPNLICVGSAFSEGSLSPTGISWDPTERYNYTQIFRSTLEMTRTAQRTKLRTGDAVAEAKREANEVLMNDVERAMWFGKRSTGTLDGKPIRTFNGIIESIPAGNKVAATSGEFDMDDLEGWMERIFAYGSNEKMCFAGNRALSAINTCVRKNAAYQIVGGEKEYGMTVNKLICPFGSLVIKTHPLWNQMPGGTTGGTAYFGMNSTLIALDMENIKFVHLEGDDIRYEPKLEAPGFDGLKSGYIGEISIEVGLTETHFMIENLNTGKADT